MREMSCYARIQRRSARVQQEDNSALVIISPTGKERHFVVTPHKLFGQLRNDPLSAAIETRRNALNEWSDLRDLHDY